MEMSCIVRTSTPMYPRDLQIRKRFTKLHLKNVERSQTPTARSLLRLDYTFFYEWYQQILRSGLLGPSTAVEGERGLFDHRKTYNLLFASSLNQSSATLVCP